MQSTQHRMSLVKLFASIAATLAGSAAIGVGVLAVFTNMGHFAEGLPERMGGVTVLTVGAVLLVAGFFGLRKSKTSSVQKAEEAQLFPLWARGIIWSAVFVFALMLANLVYSLPQEHAPAQLFVNGLLAVGCIVGIRRALKVLLMSKERQPPDAP